MHFFRTDSFLEMQNWFILSNYIMKTLTVHNIWFPKTTCSLRKVKTVHAWFIKYTERFSIEFHLVRIFSNNFCEWRKRRPLQLCWNKQISSKTDRYEGCLNQGKVWYLRVRWSTLIYDQRQANNSKSNDPPCQIADPHDNWRTITIEAVMPDRLSPDYRAVQLEQCSTTLSAHYYALFHWLM